jgi:hypothetical protein
VDIITNYTKVNDGKEMDKIVYFPCMRKSIGPVYKEVIRAVTANFNNIQHMKCNDTINIKHILYYHHCSHTRIGCMKN